MTSTDKGLYSQSHGFSSSHIWVWPERRLSAKELMLSNCGAGEDSWVLWVARWSNQSSLKDINPDYSLEGLMLKLKLQQSGHLMGKANTLEKTLMLGKIEGKKSRGAQKMLRVIVYFILELFQELWYVQYIVSLNYYFNSIARQVNPKLILRESTKLQSSQHLTYANKDLHIPTVPPTRIHILSQFHKGNIISWCFRWYGRSKN